MRLFLIAALVCFVLALLIVLGAATTILGAGYLAWMLGGFIALVCEWMFGSRLAVTRTSRND